jgi:cytochrome c peroxidase
MKLIIGFCTLLCFISCEVDAPIINHYNLEIPNGFPEINYPNDNLPNHERIALGKRLFFDPILSRDSTISCGSCHFQEFAFADNKAVSPGVESKLGTRNSMSLVNLAYADFFLREGGVPTLEMQVLAPIQDHNEMDFNIIPVAERMKLIPSYIAQSLKAYNREPDAFVITRALAAFERTLISGNSNYDKNRMNESERDGKALFFSDSLACSTCHGTFLFTNQGIENNGLYAQYPDSGRYILTHLQEDIGKFKVPTLRNIELTAPYMHDGSILNLEEVISHYASGGKSHFNQSSLITEFTLTNVEKANLIAFLYSLTDDEFIANSNFEE